MFRCWFLFLIPYALHSQFAAGRTRLNVVNIDANENNTEDLPLFDFRTIAKATNNFSSNYKLGEGGFGSVFKVIIICANNIIFNTVAWCHSWDMKSEKQVCTNFVTGYETNSDDFSRVF